MKIKKSPGRIAFLIFLYLFLVLLGLIFLAPVWHVIMASFSQSDILSAHPGLVFWPLGEPTLGGYRIVLSSPNILTGYANTAFYVIIGTIISTGLTILGAYAFSRKRFEKRNFFMLFLSFTMLFNGGMVPTYMVVRGLGMYNSRWAVIIPSAISMFNMIILRTAFADVPDALEESARLEGAGEWTVMTKIIVPLSKATIAVIVLYYAVGLWNSWFPAMIYLKDRSKYPLQLILREILLLNDTAVMTTSADAVKNVQTERKLVKYTTIIVSTVPIMCFYPFIQKYFTKGVMIGAVKG
ncbi:MAG: carbohydrate ABC transporter permease [Firmicutes bacterium]|nr:carbohydrate ABC transporter permease [Bacillota bacterium]